MSVRSKVKANDPGLKKLHLVFEPQEYFENNEDSFREFCYDLAKNTHIYYVLLERRFVRGIDDDRYQKVLNAIARIPNLAEVEIWSVRVPLSFVCGIMSKAPKLSRISMGMVTIQMTSASILDCSALSHHPSLEQFCLSDFRVHTAENSDSTAFNMDSLWEALGTCPKLANVEIFSNQSGRTLWSANGLAQLSHSPCLNQLTLRRLNLGAEDIFPLAEHLKTRGRQSSLKILNLAQNRIGDDGSIAIAGATNACQIIELDLRDNSLSQEGSVSVLPALLNRNTLLEKLNLSSNKIRDDGGQLLAEILENDSLGLQLKYLNIARVGITDVAGCRLAQALRINKHLHSLNLAHNAIANESYVAFGGVLEKHNRTLLDMNLQCDRKNVHLSGCEALLKAAEENHFLETISTNLGSSYEVKSAKFGYSTRIRMFLRLNHAGRRRLLGDQQGNRNAWVEALSSVNDDLHAIHYFISTNPALCQLYE